MRAAVVIIVILATFAAAANRRIVTESITVEAGDTLRIPPGTEMLFADLTGIIVMGRLEVIGNRDKPIIFASINDTIGIAEAFDWNGVEITGGGSAAFAFVHISGASAGIIADDPQSVTITECIFENNGQWHLSVGGDTPPVPEGKPYTLGAIAPTATAAPIVTPETAMPPKGNRRAWRLTLGGTAAAAAIGGAVLLQDSADVWGWSLIGLATANIVCLTIFF